VSDPGGADRRPDGAAPGAPRWTPLAVAYLVIAVIGLVGTWTLNVLSATSGRGVAEEWAATGFGVGSLQVDLLVLAVACGALIVVEGRRIGMRRAWLFLPLAAVTAAAFAVPLFLALRERRLAAGTTGSAGVAQPPASDRTTRLP